jgi:pre-mRNA cleavage complex 2 protein Pcf11
MSENGPANNQITKDDVKATEGVTKSGSDAPDKLETVVIDDEGDADVIDDEQLDEYQEMVDQLGGFPVCSRDAERVTAFLSSLMSLPYQDKVKINSLSMVAEDHADSRQSSARLYDCIRKPLVSPSVSRDRKLPLVYVLDSILKNVKGNFIPIMEEDIKTWMPLVHTALAEDQRQKLKRVWTMWHEFHIFREDAWKEMGQCFLTAQTVATRAVCLVIFAYSRRPIRVCLSFSNH